MNKNLLLLSICATVIFLPACRREHEIYNVTNHVMPDDAQQMSENEVARLIKLAGNNRGWECNSMGPNKIRCQRSRRHHKAVVDVIYNHRTFSIQHVETKNMLENGGTVHRNYNRWVNNLETDIVETLKNKGISQKRK